MLSEETKKRVTQNAGKAIKDIIKLYNLPIFDKKLVGALIEAYLIGSEDTIIELQKIEEENKNTIPF